jgi:hypothetical protein
MAESNSLVSHELPLSNTGDISGQHTGAQRAQRQKGEDFCESHVE